MNLKPKSRVLSIQSHVVFGYVGNKAAVFPLQALGFEVDPINSVQFSNHTGYGCCKGQILNSDDLNILLEGLEINKLNDYSHLLTGYINSTSFLHRIAKLCRELKKKNPELIYVCDPVMGDNGKMYVSDDMLPIYRDEIISIADIITPNQYEVELLTGMKISSIEDAWIAVDCLHSKGCPTVIVTSTNLGNDDKLIGLASGRRGTKQVKYLIEIPKYNYNFTGTGDIFASLFLAWFTKTDHDIKLSLEKTIATLQSILIRTIAANSTIPCDNVISPKNIELKLIQSLNDILSPTIEIYGRLIQD